MANDKIAVIVAHPDDEVLAFGGTMCGHVDRGEPVSVLILATGLAARTTDGQVDSASLKRLREEARAANKVLGVEHVEFADFPDNRMDSVPLLDVIKRVLTFVEKVDPAIVYTHHQGDLNVDHEATRVRSLRHVGRCPLSDTQDLRGRGPVIERYSLANQRFVPTYVGIDRYVRRKCRRCNVLHGNS